MQDQIQQDLKNAMLSKNEVEVSTLRLLLSELNNLKIQKGSDLTDSDIVSVVQKELKKRKEAIESYQKGEREDLASKEKAEAQVLESYLPAQISDEELTKIVDEAINELGANSASQMGQVIGKVMGKVGQGADGGRVSSIVRAKLSQ